jgi:hypothetical protein
MKRPKASTSQEEQPPPPAPAWHGRLVSCTWCGAAFHATKVLRPDQLSSTTPATGVRIQDGKLCMCCKAFGNYEVVL